MFPAFPLFFINNATFQGLKKPIIVMLMAILRFVLIPIIVSPIIKKNKQILVRYKKNNNEISSEEFDNVLFVPNLHGTE